MSHKNLGNKQVEHARKCLTATQAVLKRQKVLHTSRSHCPFYKGGHLAGLNEVTTELAQGALGSSLSCFWFLVRVLFVFTYSIDP